jgi:tetratricopeptide (TPR) repeat protein
MRRVPFLAVFALSFLSALAPPAAAQIGKQVPVAAGSPEDRALSEISAAPTNAEKIALLDKFMAAYGSGDLAVPAYEQYVAIYAADKNYAKAFEYADKGLAADPDNFSIAYGAFRAAQEKADLEREFQYGEALVGLVSRFKSQPAPTGEDPAAWEVHKKETLNSVADSMNYVSATLFNGARSVPDPKVQAALLERFAIAFPGSPYAENAQTLVANSYRQMAQYAKMTAFAQKILEKDPNNVSMLLLLADDASDRGVNLAQADQYAHKVLDLLAAAQKPAGVTEEQWQARVTLQQGLAWSAIGQVAIQNKRDAAALAAFQKAAPLVKAEPFSHARNQYRMGFALLNLKRTAEARAAFAEAASLDTPYKPLAQEKLKSLPPAPRAGKKSS